MIYRLQENNDNIDKEDRLRESVLDYYSDVDNYTHIATRWHRLYSLESRAFQRLILNRLIDIIWDWIRDCFTKMITPIRLIGWGKFIIRDYTRDFVDLCKDPEYDLDYERIVAETRRRHRDRITNIIKAKINKIPPKITIKCKN